MLHEVKKLIYEHVRRQAKAYHVKELSRVLGLEREEVKEALRELVDEGKLVRVKGRYRLPETVDLVVGRLSVAKDGYGFVAPEAGGDDLFIPRGRLAGAWHGDRVMARRRGVGRDGRESGEIERVLERATGVVVGELRFSRGFAWIDLENPRLPERLKLLPEGLSGVAAGSRIAARVIYPEETGGEEAIAHFLEVLGPGDDPKAELRAVVLKYDLRDAFPPEVLEEATRVARQPVAEKLAGREDFRDLPVFTIDGADAKDFDDAIHLRRLGQGRYEVGVHIADVGEYVKEGSRLDQEALARGTSVYLPGLVLPMLPEQLSNGVCSLLPGEDRLVLSVIVELTPDGEVEGYRFAESVIRSRARLTYEAVEAFLEGGDLPAEARMLADDLRELFALTQRLRARRMAQGSLAFEFPEVKVELDDEGRVVLLPQREAKARSLIEELMLLANRLVAKDLSQRGLPALYRVHEDPSENRFREVAQALSRLGYELSSLTPKGFQEIIEAARGKKEAPVVSTLLLRALKLARYDEDNLGHFGLAFPDYLHFTSPIRRYPDLVVHRVLKASIRGQLSEGRLAAWRRRLPEVAKHVSERERMAEAAERDLAKYHQARWALAHKGRVFSGTVSGVQAFGAFVMLENGVEGLVHVSALKDDDYVFVPEALALIGQRSGRKIRLGDKWKVRIEGANPAVRQIDLAPAEEVKDMGEEKKSEQSAQKRRRVVGPPEGKDRPERPVRLTVNRVYFGEWRGEEERKSNGKKRRR